MIDGCTTKMKWMYKTNYLFVILDEIHVGNSIYKLLFSLVMVDEYLKDLQKNFLKGLVYH